MELTKEEIKNNTYYDKNGKQILEGDLLKVYHFRTSKKIYYMYQVVVMEDGDFPVLAARDYRSDKPHYRLYVVVDKNRVYKLAEIVQEGDWETKRLKIKIK